MNPVKHFKDKQIFLVAIDPGAISGWAILSIKIDKIATITLIDSGQLKPAKSGQWMVWWNRWNTLSDNIMLICEEQFIAHLPPKITAQKIKELRGKQLSALKTAVITGMWIGCAQYHNWEVLPSIHPIRWRTAMLTPKRLTAAEAKRSAVNWVENILKIKLKASEHHRAEAIVLGYYTAKILANKPSLKRIYT